MPITAPCPEHTSRRYKAGCEGCKQQRRRERHAQRGEHVNRIVDTTKAQQHLNHLVARGMTIAQIAEKAGISRTTVTAMNGGQPCWEFAVDAVLGVKLVPIEQRLGRIPATGTSRRTQMLLHPGGPYATPHALSTALRIRPSTIAALAAGTATTVQVEHACIIAKAFAHHAAAGQIPQAYLWRDLSIDNPASDPHKRLDSPIGVRRRLRAMVRDGWGTTQLADLMELPADDVTAWTFTERPIPTYAAGAVERLFDRIDVGANDIARARATQLGWAPALAWDGQNINDPNSRPKLRASTVSADAFDVDRFNAALDGSLPKHELTQREKIEVVTSLARRGLTDAEIGEHLAWSDTSPKALRAVAKFRSRHNIATGPLTRRPLAAAA